MDWVALILVIIGGINWGLIAVNQNWDIVSWLVGPYSPLARVVYGLVGLAAIYILVIAKKLSRAV